MNLGDLKSSKFLKKEDVGAGVLVTISRITKENVAMEGAEPDHKAAVYFEELDKPLVLNSTNGQIIAKITGHDDDIEKTWIGTHIVLYHDPNVSFSGRLVGGIRVRAPKPGAKLPNAQPVQSASPPQDDLPF